MYFISFEDYDKSSSQAEAEAVAAKPLTWTQRFKHSLNSSLSLYSKDKVRNNLNIQPILPSKTPTSVSSDKDVLNRLNKIIVSSAPQASVDAADTNFIFENHNVQKNDTISSLNSITGSQDATLHKQRASSRASVFLPEARKSASSNPREKPADDSKSVDSLCSPAKNKIFSFENSSECDKTKQQQCLVVFKKDPTYTPKQTPENSQLIQKYHHPLFSKKNETFAEDKNAYHIVNPSKKAQDSLTEYSVSPNLSNLFSLKPEKQQEFWMLDQVVKLCMRCERQFSAFWRKHHCRLCGKIFCSLCMQNYSSSQPLGAINLHKICKDCYTEFQKSIQDKNSLYQRNNDYNNNIVGGNYTKDDSKLNSFFNLLSEKSMSIQTQKSHKTTISSDDKNTFNKIPLSVTNNQKIKNNILTSRESVKTDKAINSSPHVIYKPNLVYSTELYNNYNPSSEASQNNDCDFLYSANAIALAEAENICNIDYISKNRFSENLNAFFFPKSKIEPINLNELKYDSKSFLIQQDILNNFKTKNNMYFSESPNICSNKDFTSQSSCNNISSSIIKKDWNATFSLMFTENSLKHIHRICIQLLKLEGIDDYDIWAKKLIEVCIQAVDQVSPAVDLGGSNDLSQYIKIKAISGGSIEDINYFSGIVFKNDFVHKRMSHDLTDLRIMIITFPIVPNEPKNHYISLNASKEQEKEYILKLVARILSSKPNLLLLEKGISRIALNVLFENNVSVIIGIKKKVLQSIAFFTGADIITSLDKLALRPSLGVCKSMYTQSIIDDYGTGENSISQITKYIYLSGSNPERGGSVILRGEQKSKLKSLKKVTRMLLSLGYSMATETALIFNQFGTVIGYKEQTYENSEFSSIEDSEIKSILQKYMESIITTSPYIQLKLPFELYVMLDSEKKLQVLKKNFEHLNLNVVGNSVAYIPANQPTQNEMDSNFPYLVLKMQKITDESRTFQAYRSEAAPLEEKIRLGRRFLLENPFPPTIWESQTLILMHYVKQNKLLCNGKNQICVEPKAHFIEYHCASDITIGQYLHEMCFDLNMDCPASKPCTEPLYHHTRCYIHADASVEISMEEYPCPIQGMSEVILMWAEFLESI
ncbi:hypothetical protein BB561_001295 [Smittium simulii]|uniref:FYVE-type domain-containing protein n=1 Tax=Smittium simulii TaxID=133385 RepID=A0A2T9YV83_9FUNG|nr:hypothetical protein BB561_001295 [Smittium simulii]